MKIDKAAFLFLLLFSVIFWIDRFLSVFCVGVLVFLIVLKCVNDLGARNLLFTKFDMVYFWYAISLLPSAVYFDGMLFYFKIVVMPWLVYFVFSNVKVEVMQAKQIIVGILMASVVACFLMLFQKQVGVYDLSLDYLLSKSRFSGYYLLSENPLGPIYVATVLATVVLLSISLSKFKWALSSGFYFILALIFFYFLVVVSARVMTVAVVVALLFIYANFVGLQGTVKAIPKMFLFLILIVAGFSTLLPFLPEYFVDRFSFFSTLEADDSLLTRFYLWDNAVSLFTENPLFGYGFEYFYNEFEMTTHNELLAQLVAGGAFSFVFYIGCILVLAKLFWTFLSLKDKELLFLRRSLISLLVVSAFSSVTENFSYSYNSFFYTLLWIVMGLSVSQLKFRNYTGVSHN